MTAEMFIGVLVGLAVQGWVIYLAVRFALRHDRLSDSKAAARARKDAVRNEADRARPTLSELRHGTRACLQC